MYPFISSCPCCCFTVGESGQSSFRVAAPQSDTNQEHKKTSTRISVEAVGIALLETRVEANAVAFPLQVPSNSKLPTFLLTTALQRKLICRSASVGGAAGIRALPLRTTSAGRNAPAPKASGWLSAQHELRSSRKGPRPPMSRLVDCCGSFHFGLYLTIS